MKGLRFLLSGAITFFIDGCGQGNDTSTRKRHMADHTPMDAPLMTNHSYATYAAAPQDFDSANSGPKLRLDVRYICSDICSTTLKGSKSAALSLHPLSDKLEEVTSVKKNRRSPIIARARPQAAAGKDPVNTTTNRSESYL